MQFPNFLIFLHPLLEKNVLLASSATCPAHCPRDGGPKGASPLEPASQASGRLPSSMGVLVWANITSLWM